MTIQCMGYVFELQCASHRPNINAEFEQVSSARMLGCIASCLSPSLHKLKESPLHLYGERKSSSFLSIRCSTHTERGYETSENESLFNTVVEESLPNLSLRTFVATCHSLNLQLADSDSGVMYSLPSQFSLIEKTYEAVIHWNAHIRSASKPFTM
jgi:hypothetical protein